jgi:hypothetical protein
MKPNKILLRISHFFGLRKDTVHVDDIMFRIPSDYVSIRKGVSPTQIEVDDMKSQTYKYLEENPTFKTGCLIVKQVYILFTDNSLKIFQYIDGVLYYPGLDDVALGRTRKLENIGI